MWGLRPKKSGDIEEERRTISQTDASKKKNSAMPRDWFKTFLYSTQFSIRPATMPSAACGQSRFVSLLAGRGRRVDEP